MTSEPGPVTEPPGDAEAGPPGEPEHGPRPYVRMMTGIGGIGIVAITVAAVVGLSTDPMFPLPETMPSMPTPGQTSLPSGFPTAFPTGLPSGIPTDYTVPTPLPSDFPTDLPTAFPTDGMPGLPSDFPTLPEFPQSGDAS
jgi:hypothetical protein